MMEMALLASAFVFLGALVFLAIGYLLGRIDR
jgi:hypothetical protein